MEVQAINLKNSARKAGILYFLLGIAGWYGIMYVPSQTIVDGNPEATMRSILNNEFLFRTGVAGHLLCAVLFAVLAVLFYKLFRNVDEGATKLLFAFMIVQVPMIFVLESFNIAALRIFKGEIIKSYDEQKLKDFGVLFLNARETAIRFLEMFWGLWLLPLGTLVYKSGFIPRTIGILLYVGGIGYITESITFILFPSYLDKIGKFALFAYSIGETPVILWLVIAGARTKGLKSRA